jgi:hypothetical protein
MMSEKLKIYKDLIVWRKMELNLCSITEGQPIQTPIEEVQKMAKALRRSLASRR